MPGTTIQRYIAIFMKQDKVPTLRYFARFRGNYGRVRAVIRKGLTRKTIVSAIVIAKEQLPRLESVGGIDPITNDSDFLLHSRLQDFTELVWRVVKPLMDSGDFDRMPGTAIRAAIEREYEARMKASYRRMLSSHRDTSTLKPGWDEPGWHNDDGSLMTKEQEAFWRALIAQTYKRKGGEA